MKIQNHGHLAETRGANDLCWYSTIHVFMVRSIQMNCRGPLFSLNPMASNHGNGRKAFSISNILDALHFYIEFKWIQGAICPQAQLFDVAINRSKLTSLFLISSGHTFFILLTIYLLKLLMTDTDMVKGYYSYFELLLMSFWMEVLRK